MVIGRKDDHFTVYSPAMGSRVYEVRFGDETPDCSCPDFQKHKDDPDWRCKHILVVADKQHSSPQADATHQHEDETTSAPVEHSSRAAAPANTPDDASRMLIKRSISPDGRIDSLSVEFSCPVNGIEKDVEHRATRFLMLQHGIVDRFLNGGNVREGANNEEPGPDGAVPARLVSIGGKDGRWGRRLFIRVEVNGRILWHFGNSQQLKECISSAGFPDFEERIVEGVDLDLPCRVITKPSDDGRFLNIERVLPDVGREAGR